MWFVGYTGGEGVMCAMGVADWGQRSHGVCVSVCTVCIVIGLVVGGVPLDWEEGTHSSSSWQL